MIDGWNDNSLEQLKELGISCLYHLTDKDNLASILKERGLFSWEAMAGNGIPVSRPGGDAVTHRLDKRLEGRNGCVHLYASKPSDAQIQAMKDTGRFSDLCLLSIELKAIHTGAVSFWIGDPYSGGECIHNFQDLVSRVKEDPSVLSRLSVDYLGSVHINYIGGIPEDIWARISEVHPTAIVFVLDQSCSMARGTNLDNVDYDYISDLVAESVNTQIEEFLKKCIAEDGTVSHLYDIAVIGYGNNVRPAWNGALSSEPFHTPMELLSHVPAAGDQFRWVDPKDSDTKGRSDLAFEYVYKLLSEWTAKEENRFSYSPTVIHISDGDVKREYQEPFLLNAEKIKALHTENDHVIVWNISYLPIRFKEFVLLSGEELPALTSFPVGLVLYEASSYLPGRFKDKAATFHRHNPNLARKTMGVNVRTSVLFDVLQMCVLPE